MKGQEFFKVKPKVLFNLVNSFAETIVYVNGLGVMQESDIYIKAELIKRNYKKLINNSFAYGQTSSIDIAECLIDDCKNLVIVKEQGGKYEYLGHKLSKWKSKQVFKYALEKMRDGGIAYYLVSNSFLKFDNGEQDEN